MLNVKANFKERYKNNSQSEEDSIKCELCLKHADDQENLLLCESLNITEKMEYVNLFSNNINISSEATKIYKNIWRRREEFSQK